MKRHPCFTSQLKQFPWARIELDATFNHRIFEARLGVYGPGIKFGFWSVPVAPDMHDKKEELPHPEGYIHGEMMLQQQWPGDIDTWKLGHLNTKGDIIPRLSFTTEFPPPSRVEPGQIKDWQSWYTWRGLSMASPAALLMHYPLSVYHILVDILQIAKYRDVSTERQALQIHYIGAEKELNHLPLYDFSLSLFIAHQVSSQILRTSSFTSLRGYHARLFWKACIRTRQKGSQKLPRLPCDKGHRLELHCTTSDWRRLHRNQAILKNRILDGRCPQRLQARCSHRSQRRSGNV